MSFLLTRSWSYLAGVEAADVSATSSRLADGGLETDSDRMNEVTPFADLTKSVIGHGELHLDSAEHPLYAPIVRAEMRYDRISADNAAIIDSSDRPAGQKGSSPPAEISPTAPT